jgi:hypothetical protein
LAHEETRKQRNAEQVTAGAIPLLGADAKPDKVGEDWLAFLFERANLVSDVEMQSLWSRILAGEVNAPGTFSRRTLQVVSSLEKRDAHLITALCGFVWRMGSESIPVVNDVRAKIFVENGITFASLTHLDALGIVRFDNSVGFRIQGLAQRFEISYFGARFGIELPHPSSDFVVGSVLLTSVGQELARISGATPVDGYPEHCIGTIWVLHRATVTRLG